MVTLQTGTYEHYKGKRYNVLGLATNSETGEQMVMYRGLYDDPELGHEPLFVRPLSIFLENVTIDGRAVPRFKKIN